MGTLINNSRVLHYNNVKIAIVVVRNKLHNEMFLQQLAHASIVLLLDPFTKSSEMTKNFQALLYRPPSHQRAFNFFDMFWKGFQQSSRNV